MQGQTVAKSTKEKENLAVQIHTQNILMFDKEKFINVFVFDIILQSVKHWNPSGQLFEEEINFKEIANAGILYAISRLERKNIGDPNFSDEKFVTQAIKKYISPSITNKDEVAGEIYRSWYSLSLKKEFIENIVAGRVQVEYSSFPKGGWPPLIPITDFPGFIRGLINAYLTTVANDNIDFVTLSQAVELFSSTSEGRFFNKDKTHLDALVAIKIEDCLKENPRAVYLPQLKALQTRFAEERGQWLTSLRAYIETEITNALEDFDPEKIASALEKLLQGQYDNFTDDQEIRLALADIKSCLQAENDSQHYQSMVKADNSSGRSIPNIQKFRDGVKFAIEIVCRDQKLFSSTVHTQEDVNRAFALIFNNHNFKHDADFKNLKTILFSYAQIFNDESEKIQLSVVGNKAILAFGSVDTTNKILSFINSKYGNKSARASSNQETTIEISAEVLVETILPDLKSFSETHMTHDSFSKRCDNLGKNYSLTTASDFVEGTLIRAFGITEPLQAAQFGPSEKKLGKEDFYLGISEKAAEQLVKNINKEVPHAGTEIVSKGVYMRSKGNVKLQHIRLNNHALNNEIFKKINQTLVEIHQKDPEFIESFQVQSQTRQVTSVQLAKAINALIIKYPTIDKDITQALINFSQLVKTYQSAEKVKNANFEIKRAIYKYQGNMTYPESLVFFKKGIKREIKALQKSYQP